MDNKSTDPLEQAYDETLTVQTASRRGYWHQFDIAPETFADMQEELLWLVTRQGCKFGKPDDAFPALGDPTWRGLYKPVGSAPLRSSSIVDILMLYGISL